MSMILKHCKVDSYYMFSNFVAFDKKKKVILLSLKKRHSFNEIYKITLTYV